MRATKNKVNAILFAILGLYSVQSFSDVECNVTTTFVGIHSLSFCQSDAAIVRGGLDRCSIKEVEICIDTETGREFKRTRTFPYNNVCISPGTPEDDVEEACQE